ncbi:MAG TPA: alpha/beta fold hydrolase [Microlunatus sp.]|nr:alpha/beta fold hydrolase [Microlunatus sp.]
MPRRFGRWIAVLVASSVALLAPVPMLTPAAEAAEPSTVPAIPAQYLNQAISWSDCAGDFASQCARVKVPMDWQNPARGEIAIAIAYLPASGASKGLLTSNPGGPGAAGRMLTEALSMPDVTGQGGKRQLRQYDLLGFDPRGFGASTNVKCLTTKAKLNKLPKVADRRVRNRATHAMEIAEAKLFGEACASQPLARYINTQQTVWDVDFLRQLLAKNKAKSYPVLNYVGYSYGTWLGAWYADTYPSKVGRFILDSNMQWTSTMYVNQTLDSRSFQRRRDKMLFPYLARHNADFGLGKSATSVKKKYESTRKKLATQARKALKKGKTPVMGPEDLDYIVASLIYSDEGFISAGYVVDASADFVRKPSSAKYKRTLQKRIKAPMSKAPFLVQRTASKVKGSALVSVDLAGTIVRCNDSAQPGNLTQLLKRADSDAKKYPFTGYLNTVPLCAYWKFKPQTRTIDLRGLMTKMLMFQSEGDPATAYEGALAAHRRTAGKTVMVSVDNEGQHGLYIDGPSRCLERIGDVFLFSRVQTLPTRDTRCTTSPLPDDRKVYTLSGPVSGAKSDAKKTIKAKNATVKAVRADVAKRGLS